MHSLNSSFIFASALSNLFFGRRISVPLLHPKLSECDILSSFVIQCAVAHNDVVANDVGKLRSRALVTLLMTRAVSFHFTTVVLTVMLLITYAYMHSLQLITCINI